MTTRSGGLATMDIRELSQPTLLFMSILMFIGASPSSVGGGIRTTTFAVSILSLYTFARGGRTVRVFKRQLHEEGCTESICRYDDGDFVMCYCAIHFIYYGKCTAYELNC